MQKCENAAEFLPHYWCTLRNLLSQSVARRDKYRVLILLSTLLYSPHAKQGLVLTLLAFATSPELRMLQPPRHPTFELGDGYEPVQQILVSIATQDAQELINCPKYNLPNLDGERRHFADERRRRVYQLAVLTIAVT